jgi:hypothetical protein
MIHNKQRATVVYQKRDKKNGGTTKVSVRLSPAASLALESIKARFEAAYPPDQYPSLAVIFERALIDFAADVKFDGKVLASALSELQAAGYPVRAAAPAKE